MGKIVKFGHFTKARVVLDQKSSAISTQQILKFNVDLALAHDAVHAMWSTDALKDDLKKNSESVIQVATQITSREQYLKRPDLGRILDEKSLRHLQSMNLSCDIVFIVSDGLSASAINNHFLPLWLNIKESLSPYDFRIAPLVLAPFSRVALSDEVGFYLNSKVSIILVGERPGLTAADSLGIYLTYGPKPGNSDSNRNCISNIRPPDGLSYELAAEKLLFLILESFERKISGVSLKEE